MAEQYVFQQPVRAAFLTVITPQKVGQKGKERGDPVYSATLLPATDSPDFTALAALFKRLASEEWPGRDMFTLKFPMTKGDKQAADAKAKGKDGEFFKGNWVLKATSDTRRVPGLAVRDVKNGVATIRPLLDTQREIEGKQKFYNGCFVVPSLWVKTYKSQDEGGIGQYSGVKCYLSSLCWFKDGPRIGGSNTTEVFKAYAGAVTGESATAGADELDDEIPFS
jgi:Protein of unknown function (DUF2815)